MDNTSDRNIDFSDNSSKSGNTDTTIIIPLELTDNIQCEQIVTSYGFNTKTCSLVLSLNHRYQDTVITTPVDSNWIKTIETFVKELKHKNVTEDHITMICDVADINAAKIFEHVQKEEEKSHDATQAGIIIEIAEKMCKQFFHDQFQTAYAAVTLGDHIEVLSLDSKRFKSYICGAYYETENFVPNAESISGAINVLKYKADFKGDMIPLHLRVAGDISDGSILYDLTNKDWDIVRITSNGWNIEKSPVIFKRYSNQLPQVFPSREYDKDVFEQFMKLVNVKDEDSKLLLKCYIIALFVPGIQKAIQMLHGDQGAAKTTFQELEKMLVDPSSIRTLAFPRDTNEFIQKLAHNYIAYFDNVSVIKEWVSDILCRAVTGSGFSKRQLYTDDDDIIYNFRRCVGFNGINLGATKADLLDRGLIIELSKISKTARREEKEIWREFEEIKPKLLGYIFDVLVKVLAKFDSVKLSELVRMADFARVCETISRCIGNKDMAFIEAYNRNIQLQTQQVLESNIIAPIVVKFMENKSRWIGTATELLGYMEDIAESLRINTKSRAYPKSPQVLTKKLNEIKATLGEIGISITKGKDSGTKMRFIEICKIPSPSSPSSPDKNYTQITDFNGDDIGDDTTTQTKLSSPKESENRTQILESDGSDSSDDTLHTPIELTKGSIYRLGNSDLFACKDCKIRADRVFMEYHKCSGWQ
jgi:hypothetical protein